MRRFALIVVMATLAAAAINALPFDMPIVPDTAAEPAAAVEPQDASGAPPDHNDDPSLSANPDNPTDRPLNGDESSNT